MSTKKEPDWLQGYEDEDEDEDEDGECDHKPKQSQLYSNNKEEVQSIRNAISIIIIIVFMILILLTSWVNIEEGKFHSILILWQMLRTKRTNLGHLSWP